MGLALAGLAALLLALAGHQPLASAAKAAAPPSVSDDAEAIAQLNAEHPDAGSALEQGDAAWLRENFEEAAVHYADAAAKAPSVGMLKRQECRALARLGKRTEALVACQRGLELGARSPFDYRVMVGVLVTGTKAPSPLDLARAYQFADLAKQQSSQPWGYAAMCEVARRVGDEQLFSTVLWQLENVAPDHPETKALQAAWGSQRSLAALLTGWALLLGFTALTLWRELKTWRHRAALSAETSA